MKIIKLMLMGMMLLLSAATYAGSVDINKADAETLSELSGIGGKKAQAIVDYRNANGDFTSVDDLTKVKGISVKTIEKNRDKIIVSKIKS
ncbi:MAG: helix-hairpin-helix domain-containing protein [Gammaproteobacteria bacterium]|nr:helix-hairpin-helix domain-containing protein [Gammaproteobacteria bacterium]MCW8909543.1 helix-hairpin-helix domain-containing protein [Gammaproteobacteria bacterium]MCW9003969.1 helix-hairpin-helix domain-containing protein [Gammaproteobacteria bacterium]MCW9055677.1 helix-hairpin-helix domain-containing protein [Gammaproteobacteria bacterium]